MLPAAYQRPPDAELPLFVKLMRSWAVLFVEVNKSCVSPPELTVTSWLGLVVPTPKLPLESMRALSDESVSYTHL